MRLFGEENSATSWNGLRNSHRQFRDALRLFCKMLPEGFSFQNN